MSNSCDRFLFIVAKANPGREGVGGRVRTSEGRGEGGRERAGARARDQRVNKGDS